MCTPGSMESTLPGIEPEFIVPEYLQKKQAERQSLPQTIYEIMPTEGISPSSSTTIRALHRPVVPFQRIRRRRNRVGSHLVRSGNSLNPPEGGRLQLVAHPNTPPMATATRHYCNLPMASISISILLIRQIHLLADAESLAKTAHSDRRHSP